MIDTNNTLQTQYGVMLSLVYGFISVGAGVWSELLLKKGMKSIHLENAQLYFYGMLFNFVGILLAGAGGGEWGGSGGALRGWHHPSTWLICFNIAATGLVVSAILKYYDNIIKIFAVTASNFVRSCRFLTRNLPPSRALPAYCALTLSLSCALALSPYL